MGTTAITTVIVAVVTVGIPAFFGFLAVQLRRRAQGQLVRVNREDAAAVARELETTLGRTYVVSLREQLVKLGVKPLKPPKGYKL